MYCPFLIHCLIFGQQLQKLQHLIIKKLFGRFYAASPCLFKNLGLLKLVDAYKLRAATYMYRILNHGELQKLKEQLCLQYTEHGHATRSRQREYLVVPFPRVEAIRINFGYQFVNIWNSIPSHLKSSPNLKTFKKHLSKHYIDTY